MLLMEIIVTSEVHVTLLLITVNEVDDVRVQTLMIVFVTMTISASIVVKTVDWKNVTENITVTVFDVD